MDPEEGHHTALVLDLWDIEVEVHPVVVSAEVVVDSRVPSWQAPVGGGPKGPTDRLTVSNSWSWLSAGHLGPLTGAHFSYFSSV